jgi:serine protease Do
MFQISAAVNSGNSGGPVYNSRGEVLGIVTAKFKDEGTEGLGFAIPIDDAIEIATELIIYGFVTGKPSIGVNVQTVDSRSARLYNMVEGAYVTSVNSGSAAETAGILKDDIIIALGMHQVTGVDSLRAAKRYFSAGDTTDITVHRDGESIVLRITFDEERSANVG